MTGGFDFYETPLSFGDGQATLPQLIDMQRRVDETNEFRRQARLLNRWTYLSRMAALKWVEDNPVKARMWLPSALNTPL